MSENEQVQSELPITMRQLLEAGVHFGHQTKRWNPKMRPFIFGARNGIHIIDLQHTVKLFNKAYNFIVNTCAQGDTVLFVGTKKQAQEVIQEEAKRAGQFHVTNRWLGGTLTNFKTVKGSIERLRSIEKMGEDGTFDRLTKKEAKRENEPAQWRDDSLDDWMKERDAKVEATRQARLDGGERTGAAKDEEVTVRHQRIGG